MRKKLNRYISYGLLAYSVTTASRYIFELPEFLNCMGYGLSISLMLFGIFSKRLDMTRIREFKRSMAASIFC